MVRTGEEKSFNKAALEAVKEAFPSSRFYFFERKLFTKKRGWFDAPVFPGYIFFCTEEFTPQFYNIIRKIKGFCRILPESQTPAAIRDSVLDELKLFIKYGENLGLSKIKFEQGQKIKVLSGPLCGFEGNIVAINRKKKQVTVQSSVTGTPMRFDLKYEEIESAGISQE